jgi:DNA-binding NarL/FixJ family response regulator
MISSYSSNDAQSSIQDLPAHHSLTVAARVGLVGFHHTEAWAKLLNSTPGFQCVCSCVSTEEALSVMPASAPDIIVLDIDLPGRSGEVDTVLLKDHMPEAEVVVLSLKIDPERALQVFQAGAVGFVLKGATPAEQLKAVADAHQGGAPMPTQVALLLVQSIQRIPVPRPGISNLNGREREILDLLTDGLLNKEIADRLKISFDTVRTRLKKIYKKLEVNSRSAAVAKYLRARPFTNL